MPDNADVYPVIVIDSDGENTKTTIPSHQTEDTGSGFTLDTNEADSISSATLEAEFDQLESYLENLTINHTMDSVAHPQHWQPLGMLSEIYLQRPCLFLLYSISTQKPNHSLSHFPTFFSVTPCI